MDSFFEDNKDKIWLQIIVAIIICSVIIWIISLIKFIIYRIKKNSKASPFLIRGNQQGNRSAIIYQDPHNTSSVPVLRSRDESDGIEFTYTTWLFVDDWVNYKKGEWKNVFVKGDKNAWPPESHTGAQGFVDKICNNPDDPQGAMIACPGLWFHPKTNALRIYMNTYTNMNEFVDVFNIPSHKWFHLSMVVRHQDLDIYINGYLKKKHPLSSIVRQNFGNVSIGNAAGFSGYISNLRYFDYAVTVHEIIKEVERGPSTLACTDISGNQPPYLNTNYWQVRYQNQDPFIKNTNQ